LVTLLLSSPFFFFLLVLFTFLPSTYQSPHPVFFSFSILWSRWVGDHPQEDLAKFWLQVRERKKKEALKKIPP
jgi:hypothetical protein